MSSNNKEALADLRTAVKILTAVEVISDIAPGNESGPIMRVQALTLRALDNLKPGAGTLPLFAKHIDPEKPQPLPPPQHGQPLPPEHGQPLPPQHGQPLPPRRKDKP